MTPRSCDIVVVGAGVAGLAAAVHLARAGRDVQLVDAGDDVGGRMRTDYVDGLTLDRGFQVYNTGYPEGRQLLDYSALDLRELSAGVIVALGGTRHYLGDPRREPTWALAALTHPVAPRVDLARFALSVARIAGTRPRAGTDEPALAWLHRAMGLSLTDRVLRPFLSGVLLDDSISASRRHVESLLRLFVAGRPSLPSGGMARIPAQLAEAVGRDRIHLATQVTRVAPGRVTTTGGDITCRAVVLATDPRTAHDLIPALALPTMRDVTTWYHIADCAPHDLAAGKPVITVDGERFAGHTTDHARPLANSIVLTHAAPQYATGGRVLVSSSAVGVHDSTVSDDAVIQHLAALYGVPTSGWTLAARYVVPDSLPATPPGRARQLPVDLGEGLFVAGDHRDAASIDGALASGRRAAQAALTG